MNTTDMKIEVVVIPVADADRAKAFYLKLGWRQDVTPAGILQFTPPGSGCSIQIVSSSFLAERFGANATAARPGSANAYLVVTDIQASRSALVAAGIAVSEVFHSGPGGRVNGPDPEHGSYRSLASFADPDGNSWLLQEITTRLPGRVDPAVTSFGSARDLASAMRRAESAHGEHEKRIGHADPDWSDWYASYMVAEQAGTTLPT
jgi:catechol 2,3-dioxygenase-like lactoylglutathione lyase family enzyme